MRAAYERFGSIVFCCGFFSGIIATVALLYAETGKMNKSLFEALAGDSAIAKSRISTI